MKSTPGEEIIAPTPWPVLTLLPRGLDLSGERKPCQDAKYTAADECV